MIKLIFSVLTLFVITSGVKGQALLINEFCSQNTVLLDEDNDSPDWFELYNSGSETINLLNYAISDDASYLGKWKFPSLNLSPNEVLFVFASGKDRSEISYYSNIINQGEIFSYAIGSAAIPVSWKDLLFDDSSWSQGPSGFGYGDDDDATVTEIGTLSVYVRKKFQITDLNDIKELLLHVDYDDGFVAYLNGIEIARANLGTPNTDVPYNQTADIYTEPLMISGQSPLLFVIDNFKDILSEGDNILSMQVHNNSSSSSDLTLIPFLSAAYNSPVNENPVPEILNLTDKTLHTNFKISSEGEKLFLSNGGGILIDQTDSIPLPFEISYGRLPGSLSKWVYYAESTPGKLNASQGFDSLVNNPVTFSPVGGVYSAATTVNLSTALGSDIYFTLDGSDPTVNSNKFSAPINLSKTTVIKAKVFNSEFLSLSTTAESYIIENRNFTLPIVSLATDPYNLFDWNYGIYELGPNAETNNPNFGANFWMDWERPISIEYFDENGTKQFSANGGTKIFGAWSRANAQKSMSLFARSAYGSGSFNYPFFKDRENDKYEALVLRNSGNDWGSTVMRDGMMTGLMSNVDIESQAFQPVTVFINGDYWGILNMREKVNEDFLADHHPGIDASKVDILMNNAEVVEGSADHYNGMISFIKSNNMSNNSNYDSVCKMMDVINFMEYEIAEIYYDNTDWPGNNIKFWRPQTETGKWRWILYDTDFGFGIWNVNNYANNTLSFALATNGPGWPNPDWSTFLLRSLLENDDFKKEFINRFADRLNKDFLPSDVSHQIDSLKTTIMDEIPYHIARWNHIWGFDNNVNNLKTFAANRPSYMRDFIKTQFSLAGTFNLTINVSENQAGMVQVNSLLLNGYPWSGVYFRENSLPIIAIANPGYEFSHWEGIESTSEKLELLSTSSPVMLTAVFKPSEKEYNSVVINEINYSSPIDADCGDWIELYNTTEANLDLSSWIIKDGDLVNNYKLPLGSVIPKKGYLVLSRNKAKFAKIYPNVQNVVGDFGYGLGAEYDIIKLYDKNEMLIDSLTYLSQYPWPTIDDYQTIALYNPYIDNAIGSNWKASAGNPTPGKENDYFVRILEQQKVESAIIATCFPNPTLDRATIRWTCNAPEMVQIGVFNLRGELVEKIFNGNCPSGTFEESLFNKKEYEKGIYFVQVKFALGISKTLKLVKM